MITPVLNWYVGWAMVLTAFATGGLLGLKFHDERFLGGYGSFRRRIIRLGHIALAALGMLNVLFSLAPWPRNSVWTTSAASVCLLLGGTSMPAICFLTGWKQGFRNFFFIPVAALMFAIVFILCGGHP